MVREGNGWQPIDALMQGTPSMATPPHPDPKTAPAKDKSRRRKAATRAVLSEALTGGAVGWQVGELVPALAKHPALSGGLSTR
jgi:hypothetical protein